MKGDLVCIVMVRLHTIFTPNSPFLSMKNKQFSIHILYVETLECLWDVIYCNYIHIYTSCIMRCRRKHSAILLVIIIKELQADNYIYYTNYTG